MREQQQRNTDTHTSIARKQTIRRRVSIQNGGYPLAYSRMLARPAERVGSPTQPRPAVSDKTHHLARAMG